MASEVVVPDLVATPAVSRASQITAADLAVPRLYVANSLSQARQSGLVNEGDIYLALSADDDEPEILYEAGSDASGVLVHVLDMFKGLSVRADGEVTSYAFDDPNAPADADTTYNYTVFLPEVDNELPAKMLLSRSGSGTARKINTVLLRSARDLPETAFRLTSTKRQKDRHTWHVISAATVDADEKHVARARELAAALTAASRPAPSRTFDTPEI